MINSSLVLFNNRQHIPQSSISKIWWRTRDNCRVRLVTYLEYSQGFEKIQDGDTIEALYEVGCRSMFDDSDIVIRLSDCKIQRQWITNISPLAPEHQEEIKVYLSLTCHLEIFDGLRY